MALIFCVFFLHAAWPVPEVNEPHYVGKAKHYWNPDWGDGDFFLESADAHQVFYWSVGWLTLFLPLAAVTWIGRLLTWLLLAWSWQRLSWQVVARPLFSVLSAALFVWLLARHELAGEWVVGGLEAKGFAYAAVFWGLSFLLQGKYRLTWLLLGVASAFHVLVGGWSVLAAGGVWLLDRERMPLRRMWPALLGGLALALPGLLPAVLLTSGTDAAVVAEANRIYVFERLPHHLALHVLDQQELATRLWRNAWVLLCFFFALAIVPSNASTRRLRSFVLATIAFACCGFLISLVLRHHETAAASVLRYYWYRLYDVALPLGVALLVTRLTAWLLEEKRTLGVVLLVLAIFFSGRHVADRWWQRLHTDVAPADRKMRDPADWHEVLHWVRENTPPDAHFMTPRINQTFTWHTGRSEVVTHKDMPQDAEGIVQWWRRLNALYPPYEDDGRTKRHSLGWQDDQTLLALAREYGADFLIVRNDRPLAAQHFRLRFQNNHYRVYEVIGTAAAAGNEAVSKKPRVAAPPGRAGDAAEKTVSENKTAAADRSVALPRGGSAE